MTKLAELPILACSLDKWFCGGGIVRIRAGLTGLVALVLATAVGCTSDGDGGDRPADAATATTTAHHAATPPALDADATPREVRARYEQLLGQHALLAVRLARSEVAKDAELQKVVQGSLAANAGALQQLVGVSYDGAQADEFKQLWQGYSDELAAYADADAAGNGTGAQEARAALLAHCDDWGAWLAEASGGRVQAAQATRSAQARVGRLMDQIDASAGHDYDQAYKLERQAYQQSYGAGTTLATAGLTAKEAADVATAPENLRSAFAMLLGEHMELIVDAQRATFAGSPEFEAAAAQVNANTATLAGALGGIVGPDKAKEFQTAWANHVEGLMAYTAAVAGKDEAAKAVAKENLDGFAERLALYFSDVVRNVLATDPLTEAITAHDQHLIAQVDAYAAKDYAKAQQVQDEGYQQMVGVANVLVDAIEKVMAQAMPAGGSKTGGGGTAHSHQ
ncbi:MAG: hypothetical protein K0S88_5582 [Actinomycetia bacterium]|nr:hypothetical protein [Actinomycetes bacterium]